MSRLERGFVAFVNGPTYWPRWLRRAWLLTLPVSGPLWIVAVTFCLVVGVFLVGGLWVWKQAHDLWTRQDGEQR